MKAHLIQRSTLSLEVADAQKAGAQQEACRKYFYQRLLPALEQLFDEMAPEGSTLRIDYLELDLGQRPLSSWEAVVKDEIRQVLQALLGAYKQQMGTNGQAVPLQVRTPTGQRVTASITDNSYRYVDGLYHYLRSGVLPWWMDGCEQLAESVEKAIAAQPEKLIAWIRSSEQTTYQRLRQLLRPRQLIALCAKVDTFLYSSLKQKMEQLQAWAEQPPQKGLPVLSAKELDEVLEESLWHTLAEGTLGNGKLSSQAYAILVDALIRLGKWPRSSLIEFMQQAQTERLSSAAEGLQAFYEVLQAVLEEAGHSSFRHWTREKVEMPEPEMHLSLPVEALEPQLEKGIYSDTAGLVLLSPFFERLFEATGLMQKDQFLDDVKRMQGVHLLHYVATAEQPQHEHELVLPKLLCGVELETVVPLDMELSENQKHEAEQLLMAALEHWQALKQTSPATLRETFLQREGKLTLSSGKYRLFIPRQSLDIILERVPWNFHTIRKSWMPRILFVDW